MHGVKFSFKSWMVGLDTEVDNFVDAIIFLCFSSFSFLCTVEGLISKCISTFNVEMSCKKFVFNKIEI